MKKYCYLLILLFLAMSTPALSWDGYDSETGNYVEIEKGNLVRVGETIEIYDYSSGEFINLEMWDR